eukprot:946592-Amphidinium_carterae.1
MELKVSMDALEVVVNIGALHGCPHRAPKLAPTEASNFHKVDMQRGCQSNETGRGRFEVLASSRAVRANGTALPVVVLMLLAT